MSQRVLTLVDALRRLDGRGLSWLSRALKAEGFTLTPSALGNYTRELRAPSQPVLAAIKKVLSEPEVMRRTRKGGLHTSESPTLELDPALDGRFKTNDTLANVFKQSQEE